MADGDIALQAGPQTWASTSEATVIVFGGQAGGGKSFYVVHEAAKYFDDPHYSAVLFRKTYKELIAPGGLWETSCRIYPALGGVKIKSEMAWLFPSGARISFSHLEDFAIEKWLGAQICFVAFDEGSTFPESAFWLLFSRLRSMSKAPRKFIITCNPEKDSWIHELIRWWLDPYGYPDPEKMRRVRWFGRAEGDLMWFDSKAEAQEAGVAGTPFTFIPSKLTDNPLLMKADPDYEGKLKAMPAKERLRFLEGCWEAQAEPGDFFQRNWAPTLFRDRLTRAAAGQPMDADIRDWLWSVDLASTAMAGDLVAGAPFDRAPLKKRSVDPDWSIIMEWARLRNGSLLVSAVHAYRDGPAQIAWVIDQLARRGHKPATILLPLDPAQAGVAQMTSYQTLLRGAGVKLECLKPINPLKAAEIASKELARGRVWVREGMIGEDIFWSQLEQFPLKGVHDDCVSAFALGILYDNRNPLPILSGLQSAVRVSEEYRYARTANDMRGAMSQGGRRTQNDMSSGRDFRRLL